jgi:hypothetical protein
MAIFPEEQNLKQTEIAYEIAYEAARENGCMTS